MSLFAVLIATAASLYGQQSPSPAAPAPQPAPAAKPEPKPAPVAVKIDIVLSRLKGAAKLSNLPFSLNAVTDGSPTSLRLGSNVPIPQPTFQSSAATTITPVVAYTYQNIGSKIDCTVTLLADSRYQLYLALEDSSLAEGTQPGPGAPVIRSYSVTTRLFLRDGQLSQFNVATDKVSGETIQAQVTVTAIK